MLYRAHLSVSGIRTHTFIVVIGTDYICSCKSKYHATTTTPFHILMLSFCDKVNLHPLVYHSRIFCFSDVIVGVLVFIVVDLVESIQCTNKMCIFCFFTINHAAFRNKDMLTHTQVNVSLSGATLL